MPIDIFQALPKRKKCIYCKRPAVKQTCGSAECRQKSRKDYAKRRAACLAKKRQQRKAAAASLESKKTPKPSR